MPDDPTLFDQPAVEAHARHTDPESSELTLQSLGKDTSYNWRVFAGLVALSMRDELRVDFRGEEGICVHHDRPVTDDQLLDYMERRYERRYQRNVIARQRGIIRELGWIKRVEDLKGPTGRPVIAHVPTEAGLAVWRNRHDAPSP